MGDFAFRPGDLLGVCFLRHVPAYPGSAAGKRNHAKGFTTVIKYNQGVCFNAGEWDFPDAPLRGLYIRARVYQAATELESYEPWLERLENGIGNRFLDEIVSEIPAEWYGFNSDALRRSIETLWVRR